MHQRPVRRHRRLLLLCLFLGFAPALTACDRSPDKAATTREPEASSPSPSALEANGQYPGEAWAEPRPQSELHVRLRDADLPILAALAWFDTERSEWAVQLSTRPRPCIKRFASSMQLENELVVDLTLASVDDAWVVRDARYSWNGVARDDLRGSFFRPSGNFMREPDPLIVERLEPTDQHLELTLAAGGILPGYDGAPDLALAGSLSALHCED